MTFSLKAYRAWKEWRKWTAIPFRSQGYRVDFASDGAAVTYREGSHSMRFNSEPVLRLENGQKQWVLDVYVHRPLRWGKEEEEIGEEITDTSREEMILSRVETALKAKIGRFQFVREAI